MGQSEIENGPLTLVMITSADPEHYYVANQIAGTFELEAIIVDRGRPQTRLDRIRSLRQKYTAPQLLSRVLLRLTSAVFRDDARRRHDLLEVLGDDARGFARPELVRSVDGINTEEGRAAVSETSPDVLLIYGTGIVGRRVLGMARQGTLNLHTGMSPEYRGSDCVFWPIYNREFHLIGATVHECTSRVDGGEIYASAPARIQPGDGQTAVFARCVEVGAELCVETIRRALEGRLSGKPQDPAVGREYRAADKLLRHDLSVRWLFRSGKGPEATVTASTPR